jgi:hypothetical protein
MSQQIEKGKTIFILPFRNRDAELQIWLKHMIPILDQQFDCQDMDYEMKPYEVLVIHQADNKLFNRGACSNIGALIIKNKYGFEYLKNIKIVIHDVDIYLKKSNIIKYTTIRNEIRHPYGVKRDNLGGIIGGICICYLDEYFKLNGMPNYWGWGGEDICTARRALAHDIKINEDDFIERRSTPYIIDPESAPTEKQKRFQRVTDMRNLKECFRENHLKSTNGLNNCRYEILREYGVINYENVKNVRMYDVNINIV